MVTRGVLLDVAAVRGAAHLEPGDVITPADVPGLHPFSLPMGILLDEGKPESSSCIRCATRCPCHPACDG